MPETKNMVLVMIGQQRYHQAAPPSRVAEGQREVLETVMSPADEAAFEQQLASLRAALPASVLDAAWLQGRAMTIEQGIAYVTLDTVTPSRGEGVPAA